MAKPPTKSRPAQADKDACRMITPEFRVSYPHIFKPQAPKPTDKKKYSITMLFPKDSDLKGLAVDGKTPISIKQVIKNAKVAAFGPNKEDWPELESPVQDGDDPKYADKDGYKGCWVIKASTSEEQQPGVVGPDAVPITNPAAVYPGCYARAYVFATAWEYMKRQGIMFILDHVQKTRDGKAFGGKRPVEQVFAPIESDSSEMPEDDDDDDSFK